MQLCKYQKLYGMVHAFHRGVTLIELVVVIAIMVILSGISVQQWGLYTRKSKTAEAKTNLLAVYAAQESYKQTCGTYYPDLKVIGAIPEGKIHYNIGTAEIPLEYRGNHKMDNDFQAGKTEYGCLTGGVNCSPGTATICENSPGTDGCCTLRLETVCAEGENRFKNNKEYPCFWNQSRNFVKDSSGPGSFGETIDNTWSNVVLMTNRRGGVQHRAKQPRYVIHAIADLKNNKDPDQYDVWTINHQKVLQQAQDGVN